jgi:hypothetical protein
MFINFLNFCVDMNRPNPKNQMIFMNLGVHDHIIAILHLSYREDENYHYVYKLCYLFLKQVNQKSSY